MLSNDPVSPCNICGELNTENKDSFTFEPAAIAQSADGGCATCQLLTKSLAHARPDFIIEVDKVEAKRREGGPLALTYLVKNSPSEETVEVYAHRDMPTPYPWIGFGTEVSADSSSEECFNLVQGWISDCLANHSQCPLSQLPELPTRVVHVGSANQPPRLHITQQHERAEYLALSHCWGPPAKAAVTIKTTVDTLQQFQVEIPWAMLSNTFRDAILITRRLGYQYLWIDSLCIIQGDAHDWVIEASRMAGVYANAFLVIAASGASDGDGGCFRGGRNASSEGVLRLECPGREGGGTSFAYVRRSRKGFYFTLAEMRGGEYTHGWRSAFGQPLETRAWTFQEEELATRMLFYTDDELQWRCSTANACECRGSREALVTSPLRLTLANAKRQTPRVKVETWYSLVSEYTRRDMTYLSDRLPGLSGIAACWERAEGDTYHAGLWSRELPRHLLWFAHSVGFMAPDRGSRRHQAYYAPSWSWASISGAVVHIRDAGDIQVRVVDVQTEPATANRFGPVKRGNLVLSGRLIPIKLEFVPPTSKEYPALIKVIDPRIDRETQDIGAITPDVQTIHGDLEIDFHQLHYLLPVACQREIQGATLTKAMPIASLVLRRSESSPRWFERVGLSVTVYQSGWEGLTRGVVESEINII
ncbi:HET-domain-containing protein [Parathielavia appendiculata]|uniref:HET-domain-containing protein n=1 Tax=Parathielavia appendiculata TaxID=2587402 RepID=A0AAN6YXT4_9PEZI|nr:HET-domain-containing protein [Parathielavia appendiculata]